MSFLLTKLVMQLKSYLKQASPRNHIKGLCGMPEFEKRRFGFGCLSMIQKWAVIPSKRRLAVSTQTAHADMVFFRHGDHVGLEHHQTHITKRSHVATHANPTETGELQY